MKKLFIMALLPVIACSDNSQTDVQVAKCAGAYIGMDNLSTSGGEDSGSKRLVQRADGWLLNHYNKNLDDYPVYSASIRQISQSKDPIKTYDDTFSFCGTLFEETGILDLD